MANVDREMPAYLFVIPWEVEAVGGVSGVVKNIAAAMDESGSFRPLIGINSWTHSNASYSGDTIRFRFSIVGRTSPAHVLKAVLLAPQRIWRVHRLLKDNKVEAVNFHYPGNAPLSIALLKSIGLFNGKLLLSFHGTDVAAPSRRLERFVQSFVIRAADSLVACSNYLATRMSRQFDIAVDQVEVIHNGVDTSVFDGIGVTDIALPHRLPERYILDIGAFIPRKNHMLLLEAFALLRDRYPDLHVCIAGGDGNERRALEQSIEELGLSDRVELFVNLDQDQVALLLSRAAICMQPSLEESFPLAVLEAGASGVPTVVSDIPAHREQIQHGLTGMLFPLGDPSACADAIIAILDDPVAAKRMADEQRRRVSEGLTWSSCVRQYERLVDDSSSAS